MYRLPHTYLMIFCLFVPVYGRGEDLFRSCEVRLTVHRGTTWKSASQQPVTVRCPVKHCGKSLNVSWCKLLDTNSCERINNTENVEITQTDNYVEDELISYLTFKRISIYDDGLYRWDLKGYEYELISHIINISVSDLHQGVETNDNTDNIEVTSMNAAGDEVVSWLPFLYICGGIALLVVTITVLTLLGFYGWRQTPTYKSTKGQEISTHMIPDLPKGHAPSTPVLQAHFMLNDIYSPSTAGTPPSAPSLITNGDQPLANTADESQVSDCAVYAEISHTKCGIRARKQHAAIKQDKDPEYATHWNFFEWTEKRTHVHGGYIEQAKRLNHQPHCGRGEWRRLVVMQMHTVSS
ncbi:B- and T-lymphocyte attenuator [Xiphias gladius]|uniref:B- and T-lymphocyte attenuator n=1 Tax=Xiphias gladius TaxID=8245 RepID=UPI001A99FCA2|nr:B- and T-lymphocyte attenuator [Xiphias gladius]